MFAATADGTTSPVSVDPHLTQSVIDSVEAVFGMCDSRARCVGVASVPVRDGGW